MSEATGTPPAVGDAADGQGVIHDIGYRHYSGARLGRGYIRRSLFVESATGAYGIGRTGRAKIMPMLLFAAMCLPAIVIVAVTAISGAPELVGSYDSYIFNLQFLIAIYVAGQAPASVSRDLRYGVMSLYFSRPLERLDYVIIKYAALTTAIVVLIAAPLTIMLAGALVAELPLGEQLPGYLRALANAVILAPVLAGISLLIAAMTPRRGIGVAAIIAVLIVLVGVQGVAQEIALEEGADTLAGYLGLLSPFTLVDGVVRWALDLDSVLMAGPPGATGGVVFVLVTAVVIVGCVAALLLRYRRVSVS